MPDDFVLKASGLTKDFKGFRAVDNVNLNIRRHSIHALIGPNGAGKSTCFNLLTKFLTPTAGTITFEGRDITRMSPGNIARAGLVRSFQISAVFGSMTALENVRIALQRRRHGDSWDFWRSEKVLARLEAEAMELLEAVGMSAFARHRASDLSYGRKRALEIATTLALDPKVLLLDEPMAGMTQEDVTRITALIAKVAEGRTVVMVEHNLSVVSTLCDQITVLARGAILAEGKYEDVSRDPRVINAYIGVPNG
ncbi:ABC transporter ATP-binding protein [Pseudogemmobacter faecipullorum]|uniref:ABC transporter ATP-binding protein n=1 Tax=Pseudogemmobacter faecipullorum TaxID=2755041 RepID=A0ABS8CNM3_9RHOB|nr:ABC transporter ATP-binding protein [Pseudogemmobacter faecipullorum]MCB5410773.1 ABC transporter ATP-binding protein [Pseudogemmobacter faecipullorum]